jgi:MFS family permease
MVATLPGRTHGLGIITEPLLKDLHLDRVVYAQMNLWSTLLGALLCFPAGWAIDRFGLRWVTVTIALLFGLSVWQFSMVAVNAALIFGLLVAARACGQSALSVCSIATVARWFPDRAGFAMGIYSLLISIFFALAFGAVGYSVRVNGWRFAWMQLALALLLLVGPLVLLGLRSPLARHAVEFERGSDTRNQLTLAGSLQTRAFWVFAGAAAAFNLVSSGLGLFNEAVLKERGFNQRTFHNFLVLSTLMSLAGQFACGWLTRHCRYQTLTFLALLAYATSLAFLAVITQHWQLWCMAMLLGFAGGMIIVVFFSVWSDLFGQRHLGRIQGAAQMLTVLSSGVGPLLFARCFEMKGSYTPVLLTLAGISLALAFIARRVPAPRI